MSTLVPEGPALSAPYRARLSSTHTDRGRSCLLDHVSAGLAAMAEGFCSVSMPDVTHDESKFIATYNIVMTGMSTAVCCVSIAVLLVTGIVLRWGKRTFGVRSYIGCLVLAAFLQIVSYLGVWGMRVWCPGMLGPGYCSSVLALGTLAEAAESFFLMYFVLDRVCALGGIVECPRYGTDGGKDWPNVIWASAVAWGCAAIVALPAFTSDVVRVQKGLVPVCEVRGSDGVTQLLMHVTVIYGLPSIIVMTKTVEAKYRVRDAKIWSVMRKASIFYMGYVFLIIPVIIMRLVVLINRGDGEETSVYDYVDLAATVLYQFRLVDYAVALDVLVDDVKDERDADAVYPVDRTDVEKGVGDADERNVSCRKWPCLNAGPCLCYGTMVEMRQLASQFAGKLVDTWVGLGKNAYAEYVRGIFGCGDKYKLFVENELEMKVTSTSGSAATGYDNMAFVGDEESTENQRREEETRNSDGANVAAIEEPRQDGDAKRPGDVVDDDEDSSSSSDEEDDAYHPEDFPHGIAPDVGTYSDDDAEVIVNRYAKHAVGDKIPKESTV